MLPATALFTMHLVRKACGATRFFVGTKPFELALADAARDSGSLILGGAAAVFVMFRREAFSLAFAVLSLATGWRGMYLILVAAGLLFVLLTLGLHLETVRNAVRGRCVPAGASAIYNSVGSLS
jgi:hypothetical protein